MNRKSTGLAQNVPLTPIFKALCARPVEKKSCQLFAPASPFLLTRPKSNYGRRKKTFQAAGRPDCIARASPRPKLKTIWLGYT